MLCVQSPRPEVFSSSSDSMRMVNKNRQCCVISLRGQIWTSFLFFGKFKGHPEAFQKFVPDRPGNGPNDS